MGKVFAPAILLLTVLLAGCSSLPFAPSAPENPPQVEQEAEHAGPLSGPDGLSWVGLIALIGGAAMTVLWVYSWFNPSFAWIPGETGPIAVGLGIVAMNFADLMEEYFWLKVAVVAIPLVGLAFGIANQQGFIRRWMPKPAKPSES